MMNSVSAVQKKLNDLLADLIDKGGNRSEMARMLDMPPSQLSNYLHGKTTPSLEVLDRVAKVFGVTVSELVKTSAQPVKPPVQVVGGDQVMLKEVRALANESREMRIRLEAFLNNLPNSPLVLPANVSKMQLRGPRAKAMQLLQTLPDNKLPQVVDLLESAAGNIVIDRQIKRRETSDDSR